MGEKERSGLGCHYWLICKTAGWKRRHCKGLLPGGGRRIVTGVVKKKERLVRNSSHSREEETRRKAEMGLGSGLSRPKRWPSLGGGGEKTRVMTKVGVLWRKGTHKLTVRWLAYKCQITKAGSATRVRVDHIENQRMLSKEIGDYVATRAPQQSEGGRIGSKKGASGSSKHQHL